MSEIKKLICTAICTIFCLHSESIISYAEEYNSGVALDILNYVVNSSEYVEKYDANLDLEVNSEDALDILKCVCGLINSPKPENPDIFSAYYDKAQKIIDTMTVEDKVGQLFLLGVDKYNVETEIKKYQPGGIVLFAYNFEENTISSQQQEISSYQSASKYPLIIATDEEGGSVVRISKYSNFRKSPFLSPQEIYAESGIDGVFNETCEKAELLSDLGLNTNLAPVADVCTNFSSYIYSRTFGKSATETADFIETSVNAYNESGLGCTLKHFPGYGDNLNTHNTQSYDGRTLDYFFKNDLKVFKRGIDTGAPIVMVNHNTISCFDNENPASLSPEIHRILKDVLGFSGIIVTDSLDMGATANISDAYVKAVQAGNDMITTCDADGYYEVLNAVKQGIISEERIDYSVKKILAYKLCYNIISE
jgi:beta-N-acetylhexosaminidase